MSSLFFLFFPACTPENSGEKHSEAAVDSNPDSATDSPTDSEDSAWPKQIRLQTPEVGTESDFLVLATGEQDSTAGDLNLYQGRVLSLSSSVDASVCAKGVYEQLDDIPTDTESCPADVEGAWRRFAYLDSARIHTEAESYTIGLGLLVRDVEHTAVYRLRVLGDSYSAEGISTVFFDYAPVP
jgi:hypothetical protein